MTLTSARSFLIVASLAISGTLFVFFLLAPLFGYPLTFGQARQLLELNLPVFLGYLGSAAHFVFRSGDEERPPRLRSRKLLRLLLQGPLAVFALTVTVALIAFGVSNGAAAEPGTGMRLQELSSLLALALGFLTASTSVLASYLFARAEKGQAGVEVAAEAL